MVAETFSRNRLHSFEKSLYHCAIFKKKFFPKLSDLIVLENLVDTQLILGDPYSANQFELCLKLEKSLNITPN